MTTDDVVSTLVRDLKPVAPLPAPGVRAWYWSLVASVSGGLAVAVFGLRPDIAGAAGTISFQAHTMFLVLATVLASGAALALAIPGERLSRVRRSAPIAAAVAWAAWLLAELAGAVGGSSAAWAIDSGWGCVAKAITMAAIPGAALLIMIARGAPVDARQALMFAALAAAGVGGLGVEFTCPKTAAMHLLVWHFGPVLVLPVVAALAGAPLFTMWMRRQQGLRP